MVIRHENMVFKDRRTEEHGDCLRGVRQENRRTCSLVEGQNMFFCSYVFQKTCSSVLMSFKKNMFFCSHVFQKIENKE